MAPSIALHLFIHSLISLVMQATPRVMPDVVLLPDGTVVMVNGAAYGIAGGSPGNSNAFNNNNYGPRWGWVPLHL